VELHPELESTSYSTNLASDDWYKAIIVAKDISVKYSTQLQHENIINTLQNKHRHSQICIYPDTVPPIHVISYHVATDKFPSQHSDKFRSIFSDNLQPMATCGKKARDALLVDQHCGNSCSIKRALVDSARTPSHWGGAVTYRCVVNTHTVIFFADDNSSTIT